MCRKALMFLQIITCAFSYGMESQVVYEYPHNIQRDSTQRNLNLALSKITHQIQIGNDIELYCGTTDTKIVSPTHSPTFWHFKACEHQLSCSKAIESQDPRSWKKIQCFSNRNCGSSLKITNPTERDTGLYRCSIYSSPSKPTLEKRVVKTYFLEVRNTTIPSPVIVDGPKNTTTLTDSQVVLLCCVDSLIRPSITWFKRQEGSLTSSNGTTNFIEYSDIHGVSHYYAPLESAGERLLTDGVYLSKLILNGVTDHDTGFYGCVAMNYGGYKIQEAYLNVLDTLDDENTEHEPDIRSLFLLFLIPVGLALAPLTLWICYVLFKKQGIKPGDHKIDTNGNNYVRVNRIIVL